MICPACRREVKKGWKFCPYCGSKLIIDLLNINRTNQGTKMARKMKIPISSLKVIEPEAVEFKERGYSKLVIRLDGVSSASSIFVRKVSKSVEINAFTPRIRYFKIVDLNGRRIVKKVFRQPNLIIVLR